MTVDIYIKLICAHGKVFFSYLHWVAIVLACPQPVQQFFPT